MSLAASLSVYLCIVTMLDSQAARTIVSNYMDTDMVVKNDTACKEKSEDRRDILDEAFVKSIKKNAGVSEVHSMIFAEITVPWEPDFAEMWMKEFYAKWMSIPYSKEKDEYQNHSENFGSSLIGIDEQEFDYLNNSLTHPINKEDFLSGKACIVYRNGLDLSDADIIGKNVTCALYEDQQTTKTFTIEGVTDENYYTALLGYPPTMIVSDQVVKTFANHPITLKTSIKYHKEYDRDTEQEILALLEKNDNAKEKDPLKLRAYLESIGDCVVVVDDSSIIKVHVHSNEPGNVIQAGLKYGQLINIKIDNMRYQHANADVGVKDGEKPVEPEVCEPENEYGFVAVCAGSGLEELFSDIGADTIVSGGQTMNPSTDDILSAIEKTPAKVVYVLPNNKNIIMAAEQAGPMAKDRDVRVLPTKTIPQGISAMLSFDETASADENQMNMISAFENVETAQVTFAARDSEVDGKPIKKGEIMGLCNGKIKFIGESVTDIAIKSTQKLFKKGEHSLITIIFGEGASEEDATIVEEALSKKFGNDVEISIVNGNQPIYYFIISVE